MIFFTSELTKRYLKPGEMQILTTPTLIVTVLGSCLSVTMFNRRLALGAICHSILPRCDRKTESCDDCLDPFKYVDCSMRKMVDAFRQFNVNPGEIEAKVFGGADMFGTRPKKSVFPIGKQNVRAAKAIIRSEGVKVLAWDTGGSQGRKILFYSHSGEVLLKRVENIGKAFDPEI